MISSKEFPIPKVSIGMPVYNGEKYIREALDSLLAQTYTDFELIISDNASTDGTEAICREYMNRDTRIKYIRQPTNIGAHNNFLYLLQHARGEYFKWFAHDDYLEPFFLEMIIQYLDDHDDVVLCMSDVKLMDDARQVLSVQCLEKIRDHKDWRDNRRKIFSFSNQLSMTTCFAIYGVYRLSTIRAHGIRLIPGLWGQTLGNEYPFLNRVALAGRIVALPSVQMTFRMHAGSLAVREQERTIGFITRYYANYVYYIFDAIRVVLFSKLDIQDKVSILFTIVFLDPWMLVFRMFKATVVKLIGLNAARKLKYAVLRLFPKTREKR